MTFNQIIKGKDLNPDYSQPVVTDACAIEFTELEIICHSLYEMTFVDFEEESIQNEIKRIQKIRDEYDNMSEEEKRKNTKSIEDFQNELEEDDPEI